MRNILAVIMVIALFGCSSKNEETNLVGQWNPGDTSVESWLFQWSPGMPQSPITSGYGFTFTFPTVDGVHYITRKPWTALTTKVVVKGTLSFMGSPIFQLKEACDGRAQARVYFQRTGDDWGGQGDMQYYRWWYTKPIELMQVGDFELTALLSDRENWISVFGQNAATASAYFEQAIANMDRIGLTFGGSCGGYGHGVFVTGGTATFTVQSYTVQ